MEEQKKSISPKNLSVIGIVIGIVLAIAFVVIGSVFFGLKPGPSNPTNTSSDTIDPSLYRPSGY
ncbi:hypothetical protein HY621_04370 [Candidatus Uhrbacteria bacterium]|nr:hypothetical protein [Candidatus Uhrbacteria bacterium]